MFSLAFVKTRSIEVAEVSVTLVAEISVTLVCLLTDQFGIMNREKSVGLCGDPV